jgi:hypothetical protein
MSWEKGTLLPPSTGVSAGGVTVIASGDVG